MSIVSNQVIIELCFQANLLIRLGDLLSTKELLRLSFVNRALRQAIWLAYFSKPPCLTSQLPLVSPTSLRLPLSYAGVQATKDGKLSWLSQNEVSAPEGQSGIALRHVVLDNAFNRIPDDLRFAFLENLTNVITLTVERSFFTCTCSHCAEEVPGVKETAKLPPFMTSSTPAVYAGLHNRDTGEDRAEGDYSSHSSSSEIEEDAQGPTVYTVNAAMPVGERRIRTEPKKESVSEIVLQWRRVSMRHAFEKLILAFQIAYRNRTTLKRLVIVGPSPAASTALLKDEELFKLPFPMKARQAPAQAAPMLQTQVMYSLYPQDANGDITEPSTTIETKSQQECGVKFTQLTEAEFGTTVDCRYIVPFLDYSIFEKLTTVTIGRLTAKYSSTEAQFGEKATVIFAPQHIFNQMSFPCAPHLPAIYNGSIDENLRFQGRGVFVCDEYSYEGQFQDGVNHGQGNMKSKAGEEYYGMWKHGQRNGKGKVVQLSGDSLEGEWVNDCLGGLGSLETADGFNYYGQWMVSRFDGWGSIWYRGCLISYGLFSRGFYSRWSRAIHFEPAAEESTDAPTPPFVNKKKHAGLVWEESQHDDFGRVCRCFQMSLTLPHWNQSREECRKISVCRLPLDGLEDIKKWMRSVDLSALGTSAQVEEWSVSTPDVEVPRFRHDFPEEDSPWSRASPIIAARSQVVSASCRSESPAVCVSPARRSFVSVQSSNYAGNSPIDFALNSPQGHLPTPAIGGSSWTFRVSTQSLSSSLNAEDSSVEQPNGFAPSEFDSFRVNDLGASSPEASPQPRPAPPLSLPSHYESSRSKAALLQAMETVENILKHYGGDEKKADEFWSVYSEWNKTFFRRIHCDWLGSSSRNKRHNTTVKMNSPLTMPTPEEVPQWLRVALCDHFDWPIPEVYSDDLM